MKTIYIDANELKAVSVFAAKEDVRFYLKGVLVQATTTQTRLVATDGTILGMFDRDQQNEGVAFEEFIVPIDVIGVLKPTGNFPVRVTIEGTQFRIQQYDDRAFTFKPVDGRFPDYTRVIPEKVDDGRTVQIAGALLARIDKAQKMVDKKHDAYIWHNGASNSVFKLAGADRFIGVVMPLRFNKTELSLPAPDLSSFRTALTVEKIAAVEPESADDIL